MGSKRIRWRICCFTERWSESSRWNPCECEVGAVAYSGSLGFRETLYKWDDVDKDRVISHALSSIYSSSSISIYSVVGREKE
jgi:hypothetical protein